MPSPRRICDNCQRDRSISDRAWLANVQCNAGRFICRWCKVVISPAYIASRPKDFGTNPAAHLPETIAKAASSRRGRFGENANAWKGGSRSLNAQVKAAVNRRHQWSKRIFERDGWICTVCQSVKKLDAHHLTPFSVLLKSITVSPELGDALVDWLADHPTLTNAEGTTLCRICHKAAHKNWGSHYAESN
jgi:hypothetical protein